MPFSPLIFFLLILVTAFLLAFIQVGILSLAIHKLGLSTGALFLLLFGALLGSNINIPIATVTRRGPTPPPVHPAFRLGLLRPSPTPTQRTRIAVNLGGAVIPVGFAAYLWLHHEPDPGPALAGIALVAAISYASSRPVPGMGIGMPLFVGPLAAAAVALLLSPEGSAPLAYIAGTLGVLIGADLLRLPDIPRLGTPVASIGGAGTFDGIYITGIVAVLLA